MNITKSGGDGVRLSLLVQRTGDRSELGGTGCLGAE